MITKDYHNGLGNLHRFWCDCMSPRHLLEIDTTYSEAVMVSIIVDPPTFWQRVTTAWQIFIGKSSIFSDVVLSREDCIAIGNILLKNREENE